MSAGRIRSSGTPAFDYADILLPAQQPPDFHSTAARLLWKTLILKPACRSNYTAGCKLLSERGGGRLHKLSLFLTAGFCGI